MEKDIKTNRTANTLIVFFVVIFLILSGRFIYIQATGEVQEVSLAELAKQKRQASGILASERGKIFDNNGMVLAFDRPTYRIYAIVDPEYSKSSATPLHVINPKKTAEQLASLLAIDESEIEQKLTEGLEGDPFQVEFGIKGKNITQQQMNEINDLKLPGVNFTEESIRYYPNGMFASHIIGFARQDQTDEKITGVTGIEKVKDDILDGTDGEIHYLRDRYNKKLVQANEVIESPEDGHDIYLTIDQKIQTILEDVMSEVDEKYTPERITAVVSNPKTGEILAMSNRPSYNPNSPVDVENWYNDVISTPVEPGSTSKVFTWAAAIDSGVYDGKETYQSGRYQVNAKIQPINDHNRGEGWGQITFDEGFRRSSNVAASKLMWEKMGSETYLEYLKRFDLDKSSGIDLPGEVAGKITYDWPRDKMSTSFGQSSTLTPIQQIKAASAFVNEGKMMQPYVIQKVVDPNTGELIEKTEPIVVGEPISKATAEKMIELMDSVVNSEDGTGKPYRLESYSVIGKTGTAEIPSADGPGYMSGKNDSIYSFIGMAPKDDPELMMHVSVTRPTLEDTQSGSEPASFIFKNVMENGLHYLNIEPDKENGLTELEQVEFPDIIGLKIDEVNKQLKKIKLTAKIIGTGKQVTDVNFNLGDKIYPNQDIIVITDKPVMPNLTGWSKRSVLTLSDMLGFKVNLTGEGFVTKQSIKAGAELSEDTKLDVELKSPVKSKQKKPKETEKTDDENEE